MKVSTSCEDGVTSFMTEPPSSDWLPPIPLQQGYIAILHKSSLKRIFPDLISRKLTGKNTHWVLGLVVEKFERKNFENNTI